MIVYREGMIYHRSPSTHDPKATRKCCGCKCAAGREAKGAKGVGGGG